MADTGVAACEPASIMSLMQALSQAAPLSSRDAQQLALPDRKVHPALQDRRLVALGQTPDKAVGVGQLGGGKFPQFVVYQRQQFLSRLPIALVDRGKNLRNVIWLRLRVAPCR